MTSIFFLLVFLPASLAVYWLADGRAKEYVLLAISLLFYAAGSMQYLVLFGFALMAMVVLGRGMNACGNRRIRKLLFAMGVLLNGGLLAYYKYTGFAMQTIGRLLSRTVQAKEILLPMGISFYAFKAISYLADVYRGMAALEDNPVHDALYLSFFAQVQSGPLARYNDMKFSGKGRQLFSNGVYRFLCGFNKKVLLANVLANITQEVFGAPFENFSMAYAWLGSICYSLQLYFDFSGYSDMAVGISNMFGYSCMENFNYPYMTESIARFWRRWHISLSEWFRDYVYIPLGGSRGQGNLRAYFNLLAVWVLTGIWHGAAWNFIAWGLGYFAAISLERLCGLPGRLKAKPAKALYRLATLLFINFQWVLFNSRGLVDGLRFIKRMLVCQPNPLADHRALFLIKDYAFFIAVSIALCFPIVSWMREKLEGNKVALMAYEILVCVVVLVSFAWALSFIVAGQNNPFAYANF